MRRENPMPTRAIVTLAFAMLASLATPAAAQAPFKLRIASVNSPPSMHTLYMRVAFEEGIYKKNGLDVSEIISLTSGPLMTQALAAGHIDVGDTDAEGVMNAAAGDRRAARLPPRSGWRHRPAPAARRARAALRP